MILDVKKFIFACKLKQYECIVILNNIYISFLKKIVLKYLTTPSIKTLAKLWSALTVEIYIKCLIR